MLKKRAGVITVNNKSYINIVRLVVFCEAVLVLVTIATKSNAMCLLTLALAALYLLIMDLIIFKVGRKAKKMP